MPVTLYTSEFVIPSEARDLQFAANCRSLASLGMTIYERYRPCMAPDPTSTPLFLQPAKELPHALQRLVQIFHRCRIGEANVLCRPEAFSRHRRNMRLMQQSVRNVGG
jgi:hypothetical protein